jgi:hypothetical protein
LSIDAKNATDTRPVKKISRLSENSRQREVNERMPAEADMTQQPYNDARQDRRSLPISEAVAEAWLRWVAGADQTTICPMSRKPESLALPRLTGIREDAKGRTVFGVVPGEHIHWLLKRKRGFAHTERYLLELAQGLEVGGSGTPAIIIWDLDEALPEEKLRMLQKRTGLTLDQKGPDSRDTVFSALEAKLGAGLDTRDNSFLETWLVLRRWKEASA